MKKLLLTITIGIIVLLFFGCNTKSVRLSIENADEVNIFYGFSSYAMFDADADVIKDLSNQFNNLTLEPTDEKIDFSTMLLIYFYHSGDEIAKIRVDENGVFWLNGVADYYKVSSGSFDYEFVKNIYLESNGN